jgi:apolipoprotein N-acyltransferase
VRLRALGALRPSRSEALAAFASATLFALAFPPFPLVLPAILCLVPFAVSIARSAAAPDGRPACAARVGFWFGFLGYGCNLYWIAIALSFYTSMAFLGYIASLVWLAPFVAATGAALFAARRATRWPMAVLLPVVWTASEVVLNYLLDLAFPWLPLGLSVAHFPLAAQIADLSGVRGVSFWMAATAGLITDAYLMRGDRREVLRSAAIAFGLATMVLGYGAWRMRTLPLTRLASVSVVQPNLSREEKWQEENAAKIPGMLAATSRELLRRDDQQLLVWPEVALPGYIVNHPEWRDTVRALSRVDQTPLLFGVLDVEFLAENDYEVYNAAMLADANGEITQRPYRKQFLVPITERVPFINPRWFGKLRYFGSFARGTGSSPFTVPFGKFGVLICYESVFPQLSRRFRKQGAQMLVNITNDSWFGRTTAPYQHHAHLAIRAVENRVPVVRAAITGISGYIDPFGRTRSSTGLFVPATGTYEVETSPVTTLYVRVGDWLGTACLLATAGLVARYVQRRRRV